LTWKYYATKVLLHLRKKGLENKMIQLMKSPSNQISLVKGALLISQWGQLEKEKYVTSNQVFNILEGITNRVREIVQMKDESADTTYAFSVIEAIQRVLYHDMGFIVDECDYGPFNNHFIEKVINSKH
jgi:F-box protein 21